MRDEPVCVEPMRVEPIRPRILIAEDEPAIRRLIQLEFRGASVEIDFAVDGEEAWQLCSEAFIGSRPYDLIVLDASLPKMSGFEVAEKIRRCHENAKIVFWTNNAEAFAMARAELLGAPFWPKIDLKLRRHVERFLSAAKLSSTQ